MGCLSCFGGPRERRPRRPRKRRRGRQGSGAAALNGLNARAGAHGGDSPAELASPRSAISETDYYDATEEPRHLSRLSVSSSLGSGSHEAGREHGGAASLDSERYLSSLGSASEGDEEDGGLLGWLAAWWHQRGAGGGEARPPPPQPPPPPPEGHQRSSSVDSGRGGSPAGGPSGAARVAAAVVSEAEAEEPVAKPGCINLFTAAQVVVATKRFARRYKPPAGTSFSEHSSEDAGRPCAWQEADATTFSVRSVDYMRSKVKQPSGTAVYRLVGVDMYSFDRKLWHVAEHVTLPEPPVLGPEALALPPAARLPPLLIINLQLPMYCPTLWGTVDGAGHSLVYYFALPEGWEPRQVGNDAALGMLRRFVHNGRELDGQPTRDRLKLIPRIVNVDEWVEKGPLSSTEARLLRNYNDKPLLTRPQQRFFTGPGGSYLEIDLDVHSYAYIARRAYYGYLSRLAPVVFENAFVLQGNRPEELPELIMCAVRVHRVDFTESRPFPASALDQRGNGLHSDGEPEAER